MGTPLTVDASVAVKWFLATDEADGERAISLLLAARQGSTRLFQPAHWRAEVGAVLTRREPALAMDCIADLLVLPGVAIVDSDSVLLAAAQMAVDLKEHVFDTLYHAVAIDTGAMLVTADERYFRRARKLGSIRLLRDYTPD